MNERKEKSNFVENIELLDSPLRTKNQTKSVESELDSYSGMFQMPVNYSRQSIGQQHGSLTTLYQSQCIYNARISSNIVLNFRNHRKLKGAQHPTSILLEIMVWFCIPWITARSMLTWRHRPRMCGWRKLNDLEFSLFSFALCTKTTKKKLDENNVSTWYSVACPSIWSHHE